MVNVSGFDVVPLGFNTVTCAVPAVAMSLAGMVAPSCVAPPKIVVRLAPLTKLVPFTTRVPPGPPAGVLGGDSEVSVGLPGMTVQ
jgi:hypothetical protein